MREREREEVRRERDKGREKQIKNRVERETEKAAAIINVLGTLEVSADPCFLI